jgi:hypothetical protein
VKISVICVICVLLKFFVSSCLRDFVAKFPIMKTNNPYVGPRAFEEEDSRNFFGRKEETRQLASLVIAHRAVLLYAPSGAGKTSLLSAGLVPYLKQRKRINILPIARVGGDLPPGVDGKGVQNIYIFNTLLDLAGEETQPNDLIDQSLSEGLAAYVEPQSDQRRLRPYLLIVDQFEELFTTHLDHYSERADFFFQLQHSLKEHPQLSLLLSMREDYIAQLDTYVAQLPDRLRTRFRLELLGEEAARQAVQQPARQAEVDFTDAAAEKLVNDLRKVQVQQPDGTTTEQLGRHIEPVQLQVVCRRLWEKLPEEAEQIGETDVEAVGDVDTALADYYADRVKTTAESTGIRERAIREWFDRQLITEQGIRGQVLRGPERSQGLDNQAISPLVDAHLVRAEKRLNAIWYELSHDRLIEPVRNNNANWFQAHLSPLQRQAALWQEQGRSHGLLLRDEALVEGETWATEHDDELIPIERDFLTSCREARAQAQKEQRKNLLIRGLAVAATIVGVVALIFLKIALDAWKEADIRRQEAEQAKTEAERRSFVSIAQSLIAYALQDNLQGDRERAALLARQAYFLNQRYQGNVIEQIDDALRTILHPLDIEEDQDINKSAAALVEQVCQKVKLKVTLTQEEWEGFVGRDIPYESCPERIEPDTTARIHLRNERMATDDALTLSLNLYEKSSWWYPKRYVDNDFEDRGEVIVDHATGLMWQKSGSKEPLIYADAQKYVEKLNREHFAGYENWRLPTIPELMSLLEPEKQSNGLYINPFFDAEQHWCWSVDIRRTKDENSSGAAWLVGFLSGLVDWGDVEDDRYIRCVRSQQ